MTEVNFVIGNLDCTGPVEIDPGLPTAAATAISRNGFGDSDAPRLLSASSRTLAMKALTLTPVAAASRRTCLASRSSSDIVVRMMRIILRLFTA